MLVSFLEEHVSECRALGSGATPPPASGGHPRHDDGDDGDDGQRSSARVPYDAPPDEFGGVSARALRVAREVGEPYAAILRLLVGLYPEDHGRAWVTGSYRQAIPRPRPRKANELGGGYV